MGVSSIGGIGGYAQPFTTPLSSGPAAAQKPTTPTESAQGDQSEKSSRSQGSQSPAAARGQTLNITV